MASSDRVDPSISSLTPVRTGKHVVAPGSRDGLADGGREQVAVDGAGDLRHLGQRRVVLDGHGLQAEARAAAGDPELGAVERDVDRLVGQGARDVGEQPAGDQDLTVVGNIGRDRDLGRRLVVEAATTTDRAARCSP